MARSEATYVRGEEEDLSDGGGRDIFSEEG
jgi:hypothetical protein